MRSFYQKLIILFCILTSLAIICLTYNTLASGTSRSIHTSSVPITHIFPSKVAMEEIPVSIPLPIINRNVGNNSVDIVTNSIFLTKSILAATKSKGNHDNYSLNNLAKSKIHSEIVRSLNAVFKLIAGQACQHFDVSPPVLL